MYISTCPRIVSHIKDPTPHTVQRANNNPKIWNGENQYLWYPMSVGLSTVIVLT